MARKRYYKGFCNSYGQAPVQAAAIVLPMVTFVAISIIAGKPGAIGNSLTFGMIGGMWGFAGGAIAHLPAMARANRKNMPPEDGSRLVRRWQAAAYGLTVAAFGALAVASASDDPDRTENPPPAPAQVVAPR